MAVHTHAGATPRNRWLTLVRVGWVIVAVLAISLIVAALVYRIGRPWQFDETDQAALQRLSLTTQIYNAWYSAQELAVPIIWGVLGLLIFWRQPLDRGALFFSIALLTFPISGPPTFNALVRDNPSWRLPYQIVSSVGLLTSYLGFYLFPDGRFVPRWTRWMVLVCAAWVILAQPAKGLWHDTPLGSLGNGLLLIVGAAALIYRYRRTSTPAQRQQIKWVVFALVLTALGQILADLYFELIVARSDDAGFLIVVYNFIGLPLLIVAPQIFIALAMASSILRHRLWDIDLVINRSLVYGVLTALVAGLYVLTVGGLAALFQTQGNLAISLSAAGFVAVVFQPLRERLQRGVNHLMYGERDEPYRVLTRLGQRLEAAIEPSAALPLTVETVAHALKLPYVAITLKQGDVFQTVAAYGASPSVLTRLPLVYAGETFGELAAAPRAPNEPFTDADRRLLNDLARQIGVAAHAALLAADLEHARLRIVATREETRRRLGSDLHDGVGHQLAGLARKAEMAMHSIERDPQAAHDLLTEVTQQLNAAITQVRDLAHQLHPPELELLGLAGALRERAQMHTGLVIRMDAPDSLPPLPTAIETAAYYIALEALTNVEKHAGARSCHIRMALANGDTALRPPVLELDIADDGHGLSPEKIDGLGLLSMQARAAEVGGVCRIESSPRGGTRVSARLPCHPDSKDEA